MSGLERLREEKLRYTVETQSLWYSTPTKGEDQTHGKDQFWDEGEDAAR
jgi:hypothetical protein